MKFTFGEISVYTRVHNYVKSRTCRSSFVHGSYINIVNFTTEINTIQWQQVSIFRFVLPAKHEQKKNSRTFTDQRVVHGFQGLELRFKLPWLSRFPMMYMNPVDICTPLSLLIKTLACSVVCTDATGTRTSTEVSSGSPEKSVLLESSLARFDSFRG